ncbi:MAG TPA: ATP-dependent protease ATPase subunit HslU [Spirochaetota bacterium]|nr:ATP-dependent protease ATPase subunit HslU [Spirochaetota bacterium]
MPQKNLKNDLTPRQIVKELDKYIIGQENAKKAVAIALRNRSRRRCVQGDLKDEIAPKNIIMIGATGVGKTEIARRLARLTNAPFIKVEATKYTEVGYVGRDVESMIRDLVRISLNQEKEKARRSVEKEAAELTEEKILDSLFPDMSASGRKQRDTGSGKTNDSFSTTLQVPEEQPGTANQEASRERTREKMRARLRQGDFEEKYIDIEGNQPKIKNTFIELNPEAGLEQMDSMLQNIMNNIGGKGKTKKTKIKNARKILMSQMTEKLIDQEKVTNQAIQNVENAGIVFLDEIDKIATNESTKTGDVSREGVQRDILPMVEGSTVNTRYGPVNTEHILFIAAGAFNVSSPSDLIPELQGRFPIRVELNKLSNKELQQILSDPKNSLIKQYTALLKTENITIKFTADGRREIARIAQEVNQRDDNIGARRLATVMEKLLEEILFNAPEMDAKKITLDKKTVSEKLSNIVKDKDLSKYVL